MYNKINGCRYKVKSSCSQEVKNVHNPYAVKITNTVTRVIVGRKSAHVFIISEKRESDFV